MASTDKELMDAWLVASGAISTRRTGDRHLNWGRMKNRISDTDAAKAIIAYEAVDCFLGKERKKSAQPKTLVSCTGGTFFGKPSEKWPTTADDEPLIPWLQIACTEMKGLYGAFYQRKAVCFFLKSDFCDAGATSALDGSDFVVREYRPTDKLVPLERPKSLKGHAFHPVEWEKVPDYPSLSKYSRLFDDAVYKALCDEKNLLFQNNSGIKIGGWPTPVQRRQEYPGSCDLQIDMTESFSFGDSGIAYLTRSGDRWHLDFESC